MREPATCPHCRHSFEPTAEQVGALVPCPKCKRVVDVPGLRDPLWQLLRAGVVLACIGIGIVAGLSDPWRGVAIGGGLLAAAWVVSRVL